MGKMPYRMDQIRQHCVTLHVRATPFGDEKHHSVAMVLQHVFMDMTPIPSAQELLSLLVTK
jgi:hypothetical protein